MPLRPGSMQHQRPFTLIEILVVIAILGMVLAIVVPKAGGLPLGLRVANTFSTMRNAFNAASTQARATNQPVLLRIDLRRHELAPTPVGRPTSFLNQGTSANAPPPATGALFRSVRLYKLDSSVRFNPFARDVPETYEEMTYIFYPNGEATGPRLELLVGPRLFSLDVDRLTGRPIIQEIDE